MRLRWLLGTAHGRRSESANGSTAITLGAVLCAMLGGFLILADLGERQRVSRLAVELMLFGPLLLWWLTRNIRSRF